MSEPAAAYFQEGLRLARLGRWDDAAAAYRQALAAEPDNADALMNLGFVYYEMGLDEQAQEAIAKAQALRQTTEKCDPNEL